MAPGSSGRWTDLCQRASDAVKAGYTILILSDRGVTRRMRQSRACSPRRACITTWCGKARARAARSSIESGDAREVHHCALLLGYGAGVVNPYLAFETLDDLILEGLLAGVDHARPSSNYIKALNKGILKVMSKMGISTLAELPRRADLRGASA